MGVWIRDGASWDQRSTGTAVWGRDGGSWKRISGERSLWGRDNNTWKQALGTSTGGGGSTGGSTGTEPTAPNMLTADRLTCQSTATIRVKITDQSTDETRFNFYRKKASESTGSYGFVGQLSSTSTVGTGSTYVFDDQTFFNNGSTYNYIAKAESTNTGRESDASSASTAVAGTSPAAPTGFSVTWSATQLGCGVLGEWSDNATDECGYRYFRKESTNTDYGVAESTLAADSTSFFDSDASTNTTYDYYVEAFNDWGTGVSSTQQVTTTSCTNTFD